MVDAGADQQLTCSESCVELVGTASGGCEPYTYQWSDGDRSRATTVCTPGNYSLTVYDAEGQVASDIVAVTENRNPPYVHVSGANEPLTCSVTSLSLVAEVSAGVEPYTYSWSPGGYTGDGISVSSGGTYTVTVTGGNGCSESCSVNVIDYRGDPLVSIIKPPSDNGYDLTCNRTAITVSTSVSGGMKPFTYLWSTGETSSSITVSEPGTYSVTVTGENCCSSGASIIVSQNTSTPSVDIACSTGPECFFSCSNPVTLTANVSGGSGPFTYQWSPGGQTSQSIQVSEPGSYTVTVRGSNGCTANDSVSLNPGDIHHVNAGSDRTLTCDEDYISLNASVQGGLPPFTYEWSPGGQTSQQIGISSGGTYTVTVSDCMGRQVSDSVNVTADISPPSISIGGGGTLTCAEPTITLTAYTSGGSPPFQYSWSPGGQTTQSVTVSSPGTYTVSVRGANGCSSSQWITVGEDRGTPSVNAGPDVSLSCEAASVTLGAWTVSGGSPPYSYSWSPGGQSSKTITVSTPGTYTVTVTGANGCSSSDSITVVAFTEPPSVNAGANQELTCAQPSAVLTATASGGMTPYSYSWSPGGGSSQSVTVSSPGTYTVTVTGANGCSSSDTVSVTSDMAAPSVDAGANRELTCAEPAVTLTATVSGGATPYSYSWSPSGGSSQSITASSPGTYMVTVTGSNGCSSTDSVQVSAASSQPAVDAGQDQELTCLESSVRLDASVSGGEAPYTYVWSAGGMTTQDITVDAAGTYTLTVTGANGCSGSDSVRVTESFVPPSVDAGPDQELTCRQSSIRLDAYASGGEGPYTYVWSPGGMTTQDITVEEPGTYTLTVTGANGCSASDSVRVTESVSAPSVDAGADQELTCLHTSVCLDPRVSGGEGPYAYFWSPGGMTTQDVTVREPGTYTLTVTGSNGCTASDSVTVSVSSDRPIVDAGPDRQLTAHAPEVELQVTVRGGESPYSYLWSPGGRTSQVINVSDPGTYTVTVTGANGCVASDVVRVSDAREPLSLTLSPDQLLTCDVTSVRLEAEVHGGEAPYEFIWSLDGLRSSAIEVDQPGTYSVSVTDAGGESVQGTVTVGQETGRPVVDAGPAQINLGTEGSIMLEALVSEGAPPYSFHWSPGEETSAELAVTEPGTYTVTVIGANGCRASDSVEVIVHETEVQPLDLQALIAVEWGNDERTARFFLDSEQDILRATLEPGSIEYEVVVEGSTLILKPCDPERGDAVRIEVIRDEMGVIGILWDDGAELTSIWTIHAEDMALLSKTGGWLGIQDMRMFTTASFSWIGDQHLWWTEAGPGDQIALGFSAAIPGTYEISLQLTRAEDYAIVVIGLDGQPTIGPVDLFAHEVIHTGMISLGTHWLGSGSHELTIGIVGKNPDAVPRFMVGLDALQLQLLGR